MDYAFINSDEGGMGCKINICKCGDKISNSKEMIVDTMNWSWDQFLQNAGRRLALKSTPCFAFDVHGYELHEFHEIQDGTTIYVSSSKWKPPKESKDKMLGPYKIGKLLGQGGFGTVRLGTHQLTGDQVAMKFLTKRGLESLGDMEQINTEIQALTTLHHIHIIKLHEVLDVTKYIVLIFEYVKGGTLVDTFKKRDGNPFDEDLARTIFQQMISGIQYAHNNKICHRDLKLENILMLGDDKDSYIVKIIDFGLSTFFRSGKDFLTTCGTISYLAPEVFRGETNEGTSLDVWGAGIILAIMLDGRHPFEKVDILDTATKVTKHAVKSRILKGEYNIGEHVSPSAVDLISRMLCNDNKSRITIPEVFSHAWIRTTFNSIASIQEPILTTTIIVVKEDQDNDGGEWTEKVNCTTSTTTIMKASCSSTTSTSTSSNSGGTSSSDVRRGRNRIRREGKVGGIRRIERSATLNSLKLRQEPSISPRHSKTKSMEGMMNKITNCDVFSRLTSPQSSCSPSKIAMMRRLSYKNESKNDSSSSDTYKRRRGSTLIGGKLDPMIKDFDITLSEIKTFL